MKQKTICRILHQLEQQQASKQSQLVACVIAAFKWMNLNYQFVAQTDMKNKTFQQFFQEENFISFLVDFVDIWNKYVHQKYECVDIQVGNYVVITDSEYGGFLVTTPGTVTFEIPNPLILVAEVSKFLSRFNGEFPDITFPSNDTDEDDPPILYANCHLIGSFVIDPR